MAVPRRSRASRKRSARNLPPAGSPDPSCTMSRYGPTRAATIPVPVTVTSARSLGVEDAFVLLYAGNLGYTQGLDTLLEACARLRDLPGFHCLVAGSGTAEEELEALAASLSLRNLTFLGRRPPAEMGRLMSIGDLHLVSLNDHPLASMTMPSKLLSTLASGRPVLAVATGETARIVREAGAGWTVAPGDCDGLVDALRHAYSVGREGTKPLGCRPYYRESCPLNAGSTKIETLLHGAGLVTALPTDVAVSRESVDDALSGATVLVTGGTGSFGTTLTRKMLDGNCGEVRILSRDEAKQDQMRLDLGDERLRFHLGDVRDPTSVEQAMAGVDYVFHAAALKQVPSCEFFPLQAVQTNVLGSSNVSNRPPGRCAPVVCLSTDKAVYPINAMGMSKALMEKTAQAFARNHRTRPPPSAWFATAT